MNPVQIVVDCGVSHLERPRPNCEVIVLNQRRLYDADGTSVAASNSASAFQMIPIPF